jgi:uncharacterized protein YndB with AHSA1/START domain
MEVPDELRKEIELAAPRERVWSAITEPEELVRWFPTEFAEVDLRPGGAVRFGWTEGEHVDEGVIDEVEPLSRLVFRWRDEGTDRPYTRVEITLEERDRGTRLVLVETGFAQFDVDTWEGNDKGWTSELDELRVYLESM